MMKTLKIDDVVYLMMLPNNKNKQQYSIVPCIITKIYKYNSFVAYNELSYDENDKKLISNIRLGLRPVENTTKYFVNKKLDKIYFENELDTMNTDVTNLNAILEFKTRQKQELQEFVKQNYSNWKYRGKINI